MNRIRLLPEQVANQIAAGEVVERPASVVKELVENAIDAEATRIVVEVQAGGRQLVRVNDDGWGMSRDDALLCLERHATSKVRLAQDLAAISTMGFRGEALPSIASVSRLVLTTRERSSESPEATQILIQGGRINEVRSAGHAPGTTVEVRQLFFNLPARRKFLRSEETERLHIVHYLTLAALAHPAIGFTLRQDDRLVWQLPPMPAGGDQAGAVRERLRVLLGGEVQLLPVEYRSELPRAGPPRPDEEAEAEDAAALPVRVWGFIGAPGVSRGSRADQHLFVNRRPVENRGLNHALLEGYHTALMKGRYPICCLFLEIPPAEVDVNVHPAKREVRFRREQPVRAVVSDAVRRALQEFHRPRSGSTDRAEPAAAEPWRPAVQSPTNLVATPPAAEPEPAQTLTLPAFEQLRAAVRAPTPQASIASAPESGSRVEANPDSAPEKLPGSGAAVEAPEPDLERPVNAVAAPAVDAGSPRALLQVPLRLLGVVGNLYVVYESDRGLVLMDQHAAHERVLFEQVLGRLERGETPSQRLLLPETVELSARDALFVRSHLPALSRLGVGLSEFGERTFLLDALPPFVRVREARQFVVDLIEELLAAGREVNSMRLGEHTVAKTVCRHAVKANDPLSVPELVQLLEDLRGCAMPYTCPHGRPTLIELTHRDLERRFGRIQ